MTKKEILLLGAASTVVLTVAVASAGFAQGGKGLRGAGLEFSQLDTDGDGVITQAEIDAVGAARFAEIDTSGDGFLSADELAAHGSERAQAAMARMMERRDGNGDGRLSPEEFEARIAERVAERSERMINRLDNDGDGVLSAEELQNGARGSDRGGLMARMDTDEDGAISEAEFNAAKDRRAEARSERGGKGRFGHGSRRN